MSTQGFVFIVLGSLFAFLSVAAGAFGAHALKSILDPSMLVVYETAAKYQMYQEMLKMHMNPLQKPLCAFSSMCSVLGILNYWAN